MCQGVLAALTLRVKKPLYLSFSLFFCLLGPLGKWKVHSRHGAPLPPALARPSRVL